MAKLTSSTRETEDSQKQPGTTATDAEQTAESPPSTHMTSETTAQPMWVSMVCTCVVLVTPRPVSHCLETSRCSRRTSRPTQMSAPLHVIMKLEMLEKPISAHISQLMRCDSTSRAVSPIHWTLNHVQDSSAYGINTISQELGTGSPSSLPPSGPGDVGPAPLDAAPCTSIMVLSTTAVSACDHGHYTHDSAYAELAHLRKQPSLFFSPLS